MTMMKHLSAVVLVALAFATPAVAEIVVDCSGHTIRIREGNQCWEYKCTVCAIYEDGELLESWDYCGAPGPCGGI